MLGSAVTVSVEKLQAEPRMAGLPLVAVRYGPHVPAEVLDEQGATCIIDMRLNLYGHGCKPLNIHCVTRCTGSPQVHVAVDPGQRDVASAGAHVNL